MFMAQAQYVAKFVQNHPPYFHRRRVFLKIQVHGLFAGLHAPVVGPH